MLPNGALRLTTILVILTVARAVSADDRAPKSALVVPFGVDGVEDIKIAAALTEASRLRLADAGAQVETAKAPLVDILTLVQCPSGADECIGTLADELGVDLAVLGRVVTRDGRSATEVVLVRADGTIERFTHLLSGSDEHTQSLRYRAALSKTLGLTPAHASPTGAGPLETNLSAAAPTAEVAAIAPDRAPATQAPGAPGEAAETNATLDLIAPESDQRAGIGNVRAISWATMASGLVVTGFGAVFYAQALQTEDEVASAPAQTQADLDNLRELEDRGDRQKTTAAVFLTLGVAATATGVALIVWDSTRPRETRFAIAPADRDGGVAFAIAGSF